MSVARKAYHMLPPRVRSGLRPMLMAFLEDLFVTDLKCGIRMELEPWEWYQNQIRRNGNPEPRTIELFTRLLAQGDAYIDVGAHVGYHTLIARTLIGESGKVLALDPQPYNCSKILRNWNLNSFTNCVVYVGAASDNDGMVVLHNQPSSDRSRLSITSGSIAGDLPQQFCVFTRRLDRIIRENALSRIKLLKIDAEGHELNVLMGLAESIKAIENIIVEMWDPWRDEYRKLTQILGVSGFAFHKVDGRQWVLGDDLPESNLWATRV